MRDINGDKTMRIGLIVILVVALLVAGCGAVFEDDDPSLLKKAEILSVVLDPPEVGPGESVTASFLIADEKGALTEQLSIWLPGDVLSGEEEGQTDRMGENIDAFEPEMMDLIQAQYTFDVDSEEDYKFDENGLASESLALAVYVADGAPQMQTLFADILDLVGKGDVKMATRTLVVSNRDVKNENPHITKIAARLGDKDAAVSDPVDLRFVSSDSANIKNERAAAAANPYVYNVMYGEMITFEVTVEDDGPQDALRYAWVSTGGSFGGVRSELQEWSPPFIRPTETSAENNEEFDPREDPNLYPVWVVVRDTGEEGMLGQSWAEVYVRVTMEKIETNADSDGDEPEETEDNEEPQQ